MLTPGSHLCWACAAKNGLLSGARTGSLLASPYQLGKFIKHTTPSWSTGLNSIWLDPSTAAYEDYVVNSAVSGSVEVDKRGRTNFVWYAGKDVGATFMNGTYSFPNDAVKLVLPYSTAHAHAYSVSSTGYVAARCAACGAPVLG